RKLENYMLIFEQSIFGRVQKPNVIVHVKERTNNSSNADLNGKLHGMFTPVTTWVCGCVAVGATGNSGEWECFSDTHWVGGGGAGGGGLGNNGGSSEDGGSGGSSDSDNQNHPEDPDCGAQGILNSSIPSIKAPTEDDPNPNAPPTAQPCKGEEENEETVGNDASFIGEIIVDKTVTRNDLTDCVYGKLDQSNMR